MVVNEHPPVAIAPQKTAAPRTQQGERGARNRTRPFARSPTPVVHTSQAALDDLAEGSDSEEEEEEEQEERPEEETMHQPMAKRRRRE